MWLLDKGLPEEWLGLTISAVAAALTLSFILLVKHIVFGLMRARGYYNSGAILMGFAVAIALQSVPEQTYTAGYGLLSPETQDVLARASDRAKDIDWARVVNTSAELTGEMAIETPAVLID